VARELSARLAPRVFQDVRAAICAGRASRTGAGLLAMRRSGIRFPKAAHVEGNSSLMSSTRDPTWPATHAKFRVR
jgi:hypothetical protein